MQANPILGVFYHSIGGLASASWYLPFKKVRVWSWETYWIAGGLFSWILAPWTFAWMIARFLSQDPASSAQGVSVLTILREGIAQHPRNIALSCFFGSLWGIGHLTFGLTVRYLGLSLTTAVALGFCAVFGTLIPPIYDGDIGKLSALRSGQVTLAGVGICVLGIALCGKAGIGKERELDEESKKAAVAEFDFVKGMWLAFCCGITSSCMAFAIRSGKPLGEIAAAMGVPDVYKNTPVLIPVLLGGLVTNVLACVVLHIRNRSAGQYFAGPVLPNYLLSAFAGSIWYLQFFFYSMGTTKMGRYDFASWTLHMATIMIFGNIWGLILHEWKGTSSRVHNLIFLGIVVLVASTVVVGGGSYLQTLGK